MRNEDIYYKINFVDWSLAIIERQTSYHNLFITEDLPLANVVHGALISSLAFDSHISVRMLNQTKIIMDLSPGLVKSLSNSIQTVPHHNEISSTTKRYNSIIKYDSD